MAKTKSYLVKESILCEIAGDISLGRHLRLGKGEEVTGGRKKKSLLADAFEAVLGAVYIDSSYEKAREIILSLFKEKIDAIMISGDFHDFKTELQEKTQLLFGVIPEYRLIKQEGEEHRKIFTVEVCIASESFGSRLRQEQEGGRNSRRQEALKKLRK